MEHEDRNAELDSWLVAYRDACPEPEPSVNFMPELWARIEARQISTNLFGRMAKALVTAALAATVILGMISTISPQADSSFTGTYLEALSTDQATTLAPLNLDRVSELEQQ